MDTVTSLEGPVETSEGNLVLLIPLEAGGDALQKSARGIGEVEGEFLKITILPWLAETLGISEGSTVVVDSAEGKFNIRPVRPQ